MTDLNIDALLEEAIRAYVRASQKATDSQVGSRVLWMLSESQRYRYEPNVALNVLKIAVSKGPDVDGFKAIELHPELTFEALVFDERFKGYCGTVPGLKDLAGTNLLALAIKLANRLKDK